MSIRVENGLAPDSGPMHPDNSKPGYLEVLAGDSGILMRLYALGGTCLLVFLLALALFTL